MWSHGTNLPSLILTTGFGDGVNWPAEDRG